MTKTLVLVHTLSSLVDLFSRLAKEILPPGMQLYHISDETLLRTILDHGGITPSVHRRVLDHVLAAEQVGAAAVQLTCSSISPCVDAIQPLVRIPVLKVDAPMVEQAVALGNRIGIAATVATTLAPTSDLVASCAVKAGREVRVEKLLCEEAYAALLAGERERHDRLVAKSVISLASRNQVVILAQASMARALEQIPPSALCVPVLTSPRPAMERARTVLES